MCCLTTAILQSYSICQCTVQNLCPKKEEEKRSITLSNKPDGTRPVEKRRNRVSLRAQEAVGTGKYCQEDSFHQRRSYCAACQSVSWHGQSWCWKARFTSEGWGLECASIVVRLPEDQLRTVVWLICAGVQTSWGWGEQGKKQKKTTERTEKQDRMLIYANAVTQIWKRLVPLVGSWTEAWSSHVVLSVWGNFSPLTQPVHFSC